MSVVPYESALAYETTTTYNAGSGIVVVNGVDISGYVRVTTLTITQTLTRRGDTAQFDVVDTTLAQSFQPMQSVTIRDPGNNRQFAGLVTIPLVTTPTPMANVWTLHCQDYTLYLQRTLANKKYTGRSINAIVTDLLASFPPQVAITTANVQSNLPLLAFFSASHLTLAAAFDKLVRNSQATSYLMWDVDAAKDLHFYDQDHVPSSGLTLIDAAPGGGQVNYARDTFTFQRDGSQLANQVTFRGATYLSQAYTQTWIGNGQQSSFPFDYPPDTTAAQGGSLPTVTVAGVAQTVAVDTGSGFTGGALALVSVAQDSQSAVLRFVGPPANGAVVVAVYVYDLPVLVRRKSQLSIAQYGTWEQYVVDTTVATNQAAHQRAVAVLSQYALPVATAQAYLDPSYTGTVGAGQTATLVNTQAGINEQMIVTGDTIVGYPGGRMQHQLTLTAIG